MTVKKTQSAIALCVAIMIVGTVLGVFSTIAYKQLRSPTSTYILNQQTCTISPDEIAGYDVYGSSCPVTETGKYKIHLVPMSYVTDRTTIAYTHDNINLEYGIVASVTTTEDGNITFMVPISTDSYFAITSKEFRGIVQK